MEFNNRPLFKKRLVIIGIYFLMVILIFASNFINNSIAKRRAELLITACNKYKSLNGEYPEKLSDLVPEFLSKIPYAKYTFSFNRFKYSSSKDRHMILYAAIPPFGRPFYVFEDKMWGYLD